VIAGTGANSTSEALHLTQRSMEAGADACLLVTPYYNKPTQEGLVPPLQADRRQRGDPADSLQRAGPHRLRPQAGNRRAAGRYPQHHRHQGSQHPGAHPGIGARCGDRLDVFSGDDGIAAEAMLNGAKGVISVTANVAPRAMHELCVAALAGDRAQTEAINDRLSRTAQGAVPRIQPDPGEMGGRPVGPDSTGHPFAVDAAVGAVLSGGAGGDATGRSDLKPMTIRAFFCPCGVSRSGRSR
jgi:4-hydroxy-tetrahydrodipicolinate synthase